MNGFKSQGIEYCRIVSDQKGWSLLEFTDDENGCDIVSINASNQASTKMVEEVLQDWSNLRDSNPDAWTRFNDPELFADAMNRASELVDADFALVAYDKDGPVLALRGRLRDASLIHEIGPYRIKNLRLKTVDIDSQSIITSPFLDASEVHTVLSRLLGAQMEVLIFRNVHRDSDVAKYFSDDGPASKLVKRSHLRRQTRLFDPSSGKRVHYCSGKTRKKLRYRVRKLEERFAGDVRLTTITEPEQVDDFVESAAQIVEQTYQYALGIGIRRNDKIMADYLRQLAERGVLRGYLLFGKNEAIAYMVGDLIANRYSLWATSYLPAYADHSPGTVLIYLAIEDLVGVGCRYFDFGVGDSRYKQILSNCVVEEDDIMSFGKNWRATVAYILALQIEQGWAVVRRNLQHGNILDRVRKVVRSRLSH